MKNPKSARQYSSDRGTPIRRVLTPFIQLKWYTFGLNYWYTFRLK
jgi:hypothetical protein